MAKDKQDDPKTKLGTQAEFRSLVGSGGLVRAEGVIVRPAVVPPETKDTKPTE
jgi:hypothetical protein